MSIKSYEKVTENPVYFEFVDIGKALNKLKDYEHSLMEQVQKSVLAQEKYALRYVVVRENGTNWRIRPVLITGVQADRVEIQFEDGAKLSIPTDTAYLTYTDALESYKKL